MCYTQKMLSNSHYIDILFFKCSFLLPHTFYSLLLESPMPELVYEGSSPTPSHPQSSSSEEAQKWRRVKNKQPGRTHFSVVWREAHAFHTGREALDKTFRVSRWTRAQEHRHVNFALPHRCAALPAHQRSPQPTANRWKTSASLIASQPHAKARELSFLNKQQNRNESWDQRTAS